MKKIFFALAFCTTPVFAGTEAFSPYGFLLTNYVFSTKAVDTFGNENLGAPTSAHRQTLNPDHFPMSSFQVAQTRFGTKIFDTEPVRGQIEFDLIDFTKSSPTTTTVPRLRIAKIEYHPSSTWTVWMGQNWDLFSPLMPHTYNFVGSNFQAGNVGFMRHQLASIHKFDSLEWSYALGLPGNNPTATIGTLEIGKIPTFSTQLKYTRNQCIFGVSLIGTRMLTLPTPGEGEWVYGENLFLDETFSSKTQLKMELYHGQNLGSIGLLALGNARLGHSLREAGGYLSVKHPLTDSTGLYAGAGIAQILNTDDLASPTDKTASMENNRFARAGIDHTLQGNLKTYLEVTHFQTSYFKTNDANAWVFSSGLYLPF